MPRSPLPNDGDSASNNHPWGELIRSAINSNSDLLDALANQINMLTNRINQIAGQPVLSPPVAAFSANQSFGTTGVTVQFTDLSSNNPTSWAWAFGDGGTSTEQNPSHVYTVAGTYNVSLTSANSAGSSTNSSTPSGTPVTITVTNPVQAVIPSADFLVSTNNAVSPASIFFTDISAGNPTSWLWNFGDNTPTSTLQNPSHIYTAAGSYNVSLKSANAAGDSTVIKVAAVTVTAPTTPVEPTPGPNTGLRAPIGTTAPNFPTAVNSYTPNTNLMTLKTSPTAAVPTNAWFENFIVESGRQPINIFPYEVQSTVKGLDFCVPLPNTSFPTSVLANMLQNFSFQSVEAITSTKVTNFSDLSCNLRFNTANASAYMHTDIVRGMGFVTMRYVGLKPVLYTQNAIIRVNGTVANATGTFTSVASGSMFKMKFELNNGQTWIMYSTASITFNLTGSSTLTASAAFNGAIRMGILPTGVAETVLDANCFLIPTGGTAMPTVSGNTATETFTFTTTGTGGSLLMFALPHHQARLQNPNYPANFTIGTLRGNAKAILGATWTMLLPLTPVGWNNKNPINSSRLQAVKDALTVDKAFTPHNDDPYFGSKQGAKAARLALIADQVGDTGARDTLVAKLRTWVNALLDDSAVTKLRYDTAWGGIVSVKGLNDPGADFGNGRYNDHHFHYGYPIYAAAVLAKLDPSWLTAANKAKINDLVRDIANPSTTDTYFTPMRHWDWYEGHSWAAGTFEFGDNRNSESTSEGVNAYYGMYLWGLISSQTNIADLGRVLMAGEISAAQTYWQIKQADTIYPSPFKQNGVVGIVWSNKVDYATWFGAQAEYIHGIQMLPITPASEALIRSDWIAETWPNNLSPLWTRTSVWRADIVTAGSGYVPAQYSTTGQGFTNGLTPSGGSGSGLMFNVNITPGGQMDSVYIVFNKRGTGYQNGEVIQLNGSGGTGCTIRVWTQPEDGWKGVLLGGYSQINAADAWSRASLLNGWDDGSSKTQTLYHISTQVAAGTTPPVQTETEVSVSNITSNSVQVNWTAVPTATGGYSVGRSGDSKVGPWSTMDPPGTLSRTFLSLQPSTTYTFNVQPSPGGTNKTVQATTLAAPVITPIDPEPNGLPQLGFSVNGAALSGPLQASHYANLAAIGSKWIRTGFGPGTFPNATVDSFFNAAVSSGQNVLLRASLPDRQYSGTDPVDVDAYGTHMANLARAYKGKGPGGKNPVMELPNELNGRVSGATYAAMAKNAYPKVKAVDPTYQIIGGSENVYASGWATWLEDLYKGGFADYSDGLSWHNYDGPGVQDKWNTMNALRAKYNDTGYVWLTEFGGTTCSGTPSSDINDNGCLTELGQANKIVAVLNDLKNKPYVKAAILYTDEDIPSRQTSDPFEANFGIYKTDSEGNIVREKLAVAAIRKLYSQATVPVDEPVETPTSSLTISSTPLKPATFPLTASGKTITDAVGKQFIGVGDTAWNAISRMSRTEFTTYITQRKAQGYTSIFMSILDINSRTRTQAVSGTTPFTATGNSTNFTNRNLAGTISYWDQVEWCVDQLAAQGMLAVLVPCWFGYHGATWRGHIATSSSDTATATSYGTFLASRLGDKANVVWMHGGDSAPTAGAQADGVPSGLPQVDVTAAVNAMANAIRSNATVNQLHTYHTARNDAATNYFGNQAWYTLNAAYSGQDSATKVVAEWQRTNNKPTIMVEMYYSARSETGLSTPYLSRKELRQEAYQSMLSGALITANGCEYIWQVRDFYAGRVWTEGMNFQSVADLGILSRIFASFPTKTFDADHSNPVIASNRGSGLTLAPALVSSDSKVAIAYIPDARTVTLNLPKVPGAVWSWVHPETAQIVAAGSTYTVPSGWADALLVGYSSSSFAIGAYDIGQYDASVYG